MNIGEAAAATGLPAKTIRYYEEIGLVRPRRQENLYRDYDDADVHRLRFLQRARRLGFGIDDCRQLLSLYDDKHRASAEVKALAEQRVAEIEARIAELNSLKATLSRLVDCCHGDDRPECPILEDLAR